jgi:hypothetical protein
VRLLNASTPTRLAVTLYVTSRRFGIELDMTSTSFGKKASELVREIAESEAGALPSYNQDLVRTITEQCQDHVRAIENLIQAKHERESQGEEADAEYADAFKVSLLAHNQVRRRACRCVEERLVSKNVNSKSKARANNATNHTRNVDDDNNTGDIEKQARIISIFERAHEPCERFALEDWRRIA